MQAQKNADAATKRFQSNCPNLYHIAIHNVMDGSSANNNWRSLSVIDRGFQYFQQPNLIIAMFAVLALAIISVY